MKQKQEIVYIKNNIENKVVLNKFNTKKIYKLLFNQELDLKKEINLVHLKNINLKSINNISCEKDSIFILENCKFEDLKYTRILNLYEGSFQIKNLDVFYGNVTLELVNTRDVLLNFDKENNYRIYSGVMFDYCEKIEVNSTNSVGELRLRCKQAILNGNYNINGFYLECMEELKIGEKNKDTTEINLINWGGNIDTNKLNLNNCIIINDNDKFSLNINCKEILGENFIIKSKSNIVFNGKEILKKRDKDGYIIITIDDIMRDNLKSILISIKEKVEKEYKENVDKYYIKEESELLYEKILLEKEKELRMVEKNYKYLYESYETMRRSNLVKQLQKKKIYELCK